jgi:hypothetical protein
VGREILDANIPVKNTNAMPFASRPKVPFASNLEGPISKTSDQHWPRRRSGLYSRSGYPRLLLVHLFHPLIRFRQRIVGSARAKACGGGELIGAKKPHAITTSSDRPAGLCVWLSSGTSDNDT